MTGSIEFLLKDLIRYWPKKTSMAKNNIVTKNILNEITLIRPIKTIEIESREDSFLTCIKRLINQDSYIRRA